MKNKTSENIYDYIIIGSGFGGSVSSMRLSEKGYRVAVIEKGKKYENKDFPKSNLKIHKYLWMPLIKCFGFQKLTFFKKLFVLSGVGVGGGSLVYANTHMIPPDAFFKNNVWPANTDWKRKLMPFYEKAKFMLGTTLNKNLYYEDDVLKEIAKDMGREDSFSSVNVGVYFGETSTEKDPYFSGIGPKRSGCVECAGCMVGCRYNAKNTLDKNYLYFAQKFGTKIFAERKVTKIEYKESIYNIHTERSTAWFFKDKKIFHSRGLVCSGGVLGTMELLLKQKYKYQTLPGLSDKLGYNIRTNSESLCGVASKNEKLNHGIAISSVFNPDDDTHIELVKYPDGPNSMAAFSTLSTDGGNPTLRVLRWFGNFFTKPHHLFYTYFKPNWGKRSLIFLVMQTLDSSMKMVYSRFGGLKLKTQDGKKIPAYIPVGQEVMKKYAKKINGVPMNGLPEVLFNMSTTAHLLGGCPMGENAESGVVNTSFKVFGYDNMYVLDGSIIPCNLGVNPSLTITALSEFAMSQIPEKAGNTQIPLDEMIRTAAAKEKEATSAASYGKHKGY